MSRSAHPAGPRHADILPPDHPPAPPADLNAIDPAIWPRRAHRAGGVLILGGLDARVLAERFGTPLYVCDEADFRARCRGFRDAFGPAAQVSYAAKAFCCRGVLRWVVAEVAPGDLIAVAATGAYCRSMASNYNHVPRPAVVAVADGAARPLLRRETLADLLALDAG